MSNAKCDDQIAATLQEIIDHHQIRKLLSVYCHGCDRGDGPRMASVYAEGSWDDHGPYKGPGREYHKAVMDQFAREGIRCTHLLGQSQIKVTGDRAGVETYFLAGVCTKDADGKDNVTLLSGRYVDILNRDSGQWSIHSRTCVRDWSITLDVNKDALANTNFVQGVLSGADLSYAALGLVHPGLPPHTPQQ